MAHLGEKENKANAKDKMPDLNSVWATRYLNIRAVNDTTD